MRFKLVGKSRPATYPDSQIEGIKSIIWCEGGQGNYKETIKPYGRKQENGIYI